MNLASLGDMRNGLLGGASAAMASSSEGGRRTLVHKHTWIYMYRATLHLYTCTHYNDKASVSERYSGYSGHCWGMAFWLLYGGSRCRGVKVFGA